MPKPAFISTRQAVTVAAYAFALGLYFLVFGSAVMPLLRMPELLVAPIMALGSFVAGSTFLGGGAVAFPALTKILNTDPHTAKSFSLAIQSVGMSSASLYILSRVKNIPWQFFFYYLPAAIAGLALSLGTLDKLLLANDLRIGFTLFVLVFLLIYLWAYGNKDTHYTDLTAFKRIDKSIIVKAGLVGGILSGLLGSGADLVGFCMLALYFRLDIKLATQCSVIIMAATSVAGVGMQIGLFGGIPEQVGRLWLIAAPVVLIGAPVGAIFCRRVTSRSLLIFISLIVASELVSTVALVPIELNRTGYYAGVVALSILLLVSLKKISREKNHEGQHPL